MWERFEIPLKRLWGQPRCLRYAARHAWWMQNTCRPDVMKYQSPDFDSSKTHVVKSERVHCLPGEPPRVCLAPFILRCVLLPIDSTGESFMMLHMSWRTWGGKTEMPVCGPYYHFSNLNMGNIDALILWNFLCVFSHWEPDKQLLPFTLWQSTNSLNKLCGLSLVLSEDHNFFSVTLVCPLQYNNRVPPKRKSRLLTHLHRNAKWQSIQRN